MRRFFAQQWFLVVLLLWLTGGLVFCRQLAPLAEFAPENAVIALVMLSTSIVINFRVALLARTSWTAVGLALLVNAGAAPPLGWLMGCWLPPLIAQGLVVAMSVPCTVAAAIVWTRRGGGNAAAAALTSMISNFGCFLVLPFWTGVLLGATVDTRPNELAVKLLLVIAAPMLAGQLLRLLPGAASWADRTKVQISLVAQWGVLFMALLGAIEAGNAMLQSAYKPALLDWLALAATIFALHLALLVIAWAASRAAGLASADRLAVVIAGSQKSMAVGVGVALQFGPMTIFPLIAYHFTQLLIDTVIVDRWRHDPVE